jgi:hypothetical protein
MGLVTLAQYMLLVALAQYVGLVTLAQYTLFHSFFEHFSHF